MCKKALKSVFRPIKKAAAKLEQIATGGSTDVYGIGEFEPTEPSGPSAADIAKQEADAAAKIAAEEKAAAKAAATEKAIANEKRLNKEAAARQAAAAAKVIANNKAKVAADAAASASATATAETLAEASQKAPTTIDTSGKDVPTTASLSSKPTVKAKPKPKSLIKTGAVDQEQEMMLKSRQGRRQGARGRRSLLTGSTAAGFYNRFIS